MSGLGWMQVWQQSSGLHGQSRRKTQVVLGRVRPSRPRVNHPMIVRSICVRCRRRPLLMPAIGMGGEKHLVTPGLNVRRGLVIQRGLIPLGKRSAMQWAGGPTELRMAHQNDVQADTTAQ